MMYPSAIANKYQQLCCSSLSTTKILILQKCQRRIPFKIALKTSTDSQRATLKRYLLMSVMGFWNCQILNLMLPKISALGPQYAMMIKVKYDKACRDCLSVRISSFSGPEIHFNLVKMQCTQSYFFRNFYVLPPTSCPLLYFLMIFKQSIIASMRSIAAMQ